MTRPSESTRSGPSRAKGAVRFGRYVLVDRLGVGGMAEVFRALVLGPEEFQRVVVVKRILPTLSANPAFIKMFIDEAKVTGRMSHPNVIQVHEFGRHQQQHFIAMEYLHGRNLNNILARLVERRQNLPPSIAAEIMRQACRGLAYAHGLRDMEGKPLGIIHRDVSPGNVIVAYTGETKVLDFGVARVESRFRLGTTDPGHVKGKASYLAPEQLTGQGVDHRADIFAAGILLYEMLTTRRLFNSRSTTDTMDLVRSMPIPAPSHSNPQVPAALDDDRRPRPGTGCLPSLPGRRRDGRRAGELPGREPLRWPGNAGVHAPAVPRGEPHLARAAEHRRPGGAVPRRPW